MGEKEWKAFITIVEEGNITKASTRLFLSQPALSYRLRQMEESLGVLLFIRNTSGIVLTPEGEAFYQYCLQMVAELQRTKEKMDNMADTVRGTLYIASASVFANYELPLLLRSFLEKYPHVRVQVKTGLSHQVNSMFNSGDCMLAFMRGDHMHFGKTMQLLEEPYCWVYYRGISMDELSHRPFIRYKTDPTVLSVFDAWWFEHFSKQPNIMMELDTMSTCRYFIREKLGWSVLPTMGLEGYADETLYMEPICNKKGIPYTRKTSLLYHEKTMELTAVKAFVEHVKDHYLPVEKDINKVT